LVLPDDFFLAANGKWLSGEMLYAAGWASPRD